MVNITNRQKQAIHTKIRIYNAAVTLMQTNGIKNTTIEQICKEANVSVGSFYNYFKSKNDVFYAIYESVDKYYHDVVKSQISNLTTSEKIISFFGYYAQYNVNQGLDFTKHLYFNVENKFFISRDRYMHSLLRSVLNKAQDDNKIHSVLSIEELEMFMFITARGIVCDWCLHEGNYDLERKMGLYFKQLVNIFMGNAVD